MELGKLALVTSQARAERCCCASKTMAGQVWHLVKLDSPAANHSSIHQSYSTHAQRITAHTHTAHSKPQTSVNIHHKQRTHTWPTIDVQHTAGHTACTRLSHHFTFGSSRNNRQPRLTNWSDQSSPATGKHEFRRKWQQTDQQRGPCNRTTVFENFGQAALYMT